MKADCSIDKAKEGALEQLRLDVAAQWRVEADALLDTLERRDRDMVWHLLMASRAFGCFMLAHDPEWWADYMRKKLDDARAVRR